MSEPTMYRSEMCIAFVVPHLQLQPLVANPLQAVILSDEGIDPEADLRMSELPRQPTPGERIHLTGKLLEFMKEKGVAIPGQVVTLSVVYRPGFPTPWTAMYYRETDGQPSLVDSLVKISKPVFTGLREVDFQKHYEEAWELADRMITLMREGDPKETGWVLEFLDACKELEKVVEKIEEEKRHTEEFQAKLAQGANHLASVLGLSTADNSTENVEQE